MATLSWEGYLSKDFLDMLQENPNYVIVYFTAVPPTSLKGFRGYPPKQKVSGQNSLWRGLVGNTEVVFVLQVGLCFSSSYSQQGGRVNRTTNAELLMPPSWKKEIHRRTCESGALKGKRSQRVFSVLPVY